MRSAASTTVPVPRLEDSTKPRQLLYGSHVGIKWPREAFAVGLFQALERCTITNHIAPQRSDHLDLFNHASGAALKFNSMQYHWAARRDIRCGQKKHPTTGASGSGHSISALLSSGHGHRIILYERLLVKD